MADDALVRVGRNVRACREATLSRGNLALHVGKAGRLGCAELLAEHALNIGIGHPIRELTDRPVGEHDLDGHYSSLPVAGFHVLRWTLTGGVAGGATGARWTGAATGLPRTLEKSGGIGAGVTFLLAEW